MVCMPFESPTDTHEASDKDVFREIYTRALAKRLLTKATTDDDMEKTLIMKLQTGTHMNIIMRYMRV